MKPHSIFTRCLAILVAFSLSPLPLIASEVVLKSVSPGERLPLLFTPAATPPQPMNVETPSPPALVYDRETASLRMTHLPDATFWKAEASTDLGDWKPLDPAMYFAAGAEVESSHEVPAPPSPLDARFFRARLLTDDDLFHEGVAAVKVDEGPIGAIAADRDGHLLAALVERDAEGRVLRTRGAIWQAPTGEHMVVETDAQGLPESITLNGYLFTVGGFTDAAARGALVETGEVSLLSDMPYSADQAAELTAYTQSTGHPDQDPFWQEELLHKSLRVAGLMVSLGGCALATTVSFGAALVPCGLLIANVVSLWVPETVPYIEAAEWGNAVADLAAGHPYSLIDLHFALSSHLLVHEFDRQRLQAEIDFARLHHVVGVYGSILGKWTVTGAPFSGTQTWDVSGNFTYKRTGRDIPEVWNYSGTQVEFSYMNTSYKFRGMIHSPRHMSGRVYYLGLYDHGAWQATRNQ